MITDFFINLINGLGNSFPNPPSFIAGSFDALYEIFNLVNYYLPFNELMVCLSLYIVLIKWKIGFRIAKWIGERFVI